MFLKADAGMEDLKYLTLSSLCKTVVEGNIVNSTVTAGQIADMSKQMGICEKIIEGIIIDGVTYKEERKLFFVCKAMYYVRSYMP